MIDKFVPDKYFKSIYDINYETLKKTGIKCLIFDVANTLMPESATKPNKKVKDLFEDLKDMGFKLILMSNSVKKNVEAFKEELCVDSAYLSFKPFKFKYKKIIKLFNFKPSEIACIGDQILYDIYGANKMDFTSILVNPISIDEYAVSKLNRKFENLITTKITKKDLFKKGKYYE